MTALLLQNLKLIMLFLLISSIIGLSNLTGKTRKAAGPDVKRVYSSPTAHETVAASARFASTPRGSALIPDIDFRAVQRLFGPQSG